MILLDANLLIYAYSRTSPYHGPARTWLEERIETEPLVGLPWVSILAFIRITTSHLQPSPQTFEQAAQIVDDWLALDNVRIVHPGDRHWDVLKEVGREAQVRGATVTDLHLAALAIERGATLYTNDAGFRRYPKLKWRNPFAKGRS